jgi:hypothetical protein
MPIKIKASAQAVKEAAEGSDAVNPPAGYYTGELTKCEATQSKAGNPQLVCTYKITGEGRDGKKLQANYWPQRDYVQLEGETTEWKRAEFLLAMGKPTKGRSASMEIENEPNRPGTIIGTKVLLRISEDSFTDAKTGQKVATSKLARVLPLPGVNDEPLGATDEELDAADEGEIPAYSPVQAYEGPEEEGEFVPWTREGLLALEKDELRRVTAEFSVPVVDGMTKGNVIDAVLEAQTKWMEQQVTESVNEDSGVSGDEAAEEDEPF